MDYPQNLFLIVGTIVPILKAKTGGALDQYNDADYYYCWWTMMMMIIDDDDDDIINHLYSVPLAWL